MDNKKENYLDRRPLHSDNLKWSADDKGMVTFGIENKGVFNKIAQTFFKKPKISYIHLDEIGSFVWPLIDGQKTIADIGGCVKEHFGEKAEPIYERLAQHFQILSSDGFVHWKTEE